MIVGTAENRVFLTTGSTRVLLFNATPAADWLDDLLIEPVPIVVEELLVEGWTSATLPTDTEGSRIADRSTPEEEEEE